MIEKFPENAFFAKTYVNNINGNNSLKPLRSDINKTIYYRLETACYFLYSFFQSQYEVRML